jgi:protein-L-isoaspartate(D-aspartate) O-methyltransferase
MLDLNLDLARRNMVDQQLRTWHVLDDRVLQAVSAIPRERFVPAPFRGVAYADWDVPLGSGQVMTPPKVVGRILQTLTIVPGQRVLEIGTGSGYLTACLVELGAEVDSVEFHEAFIDSARKRLEALGYARSVQLLHADASEELPSRGPYDAIALTASLRTYPPQFEQMLKPGGRLFAIVGQPPAMRATLVVRYGKSAYLRKPLFETCLPPMIDTRARRSFSL